MYLIKLPSILLKQLLTLFLLTLVSFTLNHLYAQSPTIEWQKCLGGGGGDYAQAIESTRDGGYIVAGYTASSEGDVTGNHNNNGINDFWVVKLSNTGSIQWQKTLGGRGEDRASAIHQTPDGGYVVAGNSTSNDGDVSGNHGWSMDYWIVKLSSSGDIEWQRSLGGSKNDYVYAMQLTPDGGYILAGHSESNDGDVSGNHGNRDYWIVKLNSQGNIEWQKSMGGSGDDYAYAIQVTRGGGYIVAGVTESNDGDIVGNHGQRDYWVVKLTHAGGIEWQKCFGGTHFDEAQSVQQTLDGGYIVAGYSSSNDNDVSGNHQSLGGFSDYWIVKLSSTGDIQWQKCLGGKYNEHAYAIQLTPDGGYIVAGSAESSDSDLSCNAGLTDYWVAKLSSTGSIQWQKSMGGSYYDEAYAVQPTKDGGCIVAGVTCSQNVSGYHPPLSSTCGDFWIIKLSGTVVNLLKPEVNITASSTTICSGTPVTFTATPLNAGITLSYQWQLNGVNTGSNSASYTNSQLGNSDKISCIMTSNAGCESPTQTVVSNSLTMQATNNITPEVTITASEDIICAGTPVTFTATNKSGSPNPTYQWSVNGVGVGINNTSYTTNTLTNNAIVQCRMTVPQCIGTTKDDSNPITITVKPVLNPAITLASPATTICKGSQVTFTAKATDGGVNPSYQWKVNGANSGSNSSTFSSSTLSDGDQISCLLLPDLTMACSSTASTTTNIITMKVTESTTTAISINISASDNDICEGSAVSFTATVQNAGPSPSYQWKLNGNDVGSNSTLYTSNTFSAGDKISCMVTAPNTTCAPVSANSSNAIIMRVKQQPTITIIPVDTTVMKGTQLQLTASVTGPIASFEWTPATGLENSQSLTPVTLPMQATTLYNLQVVSANGCTTSKAVTIKVITKLYMPNVFTPNGDGKNDTFRIPAGVSFQLKEFAIFDRWGNKIFTTNDIRKGWDGTFKGTPVVTNTYVYTIVGWDAGKQTTLKGTVTVLP